MKPSFLFLFLSLWCCNICLAQRHSDLSDQFEFEGTGCNKIIQMHNGRTMLFHFEASKKITVMVFNKAHDLVSTTTISAKLINIGSVDAPLFKGLYEVNGEAVLFASHLTDGIHSLVRARFNGETGRLLHEEYVAIPDSNTVAEHYVLKNRNEAGYSIFCFRNTIAYPELKCELIRFDSVHLLASIVPLDVNTQGMGTEKLLSADLATDGVIAVLIGMNKPLIKDKKNPLKRYPYNRYMVIATIGKDDDKFTATIVKLADGNFPHYNNGFPFVADRSSDSITARLNYLILDTKMPGNIIFYPLLLTTDHHFAHVAMRSLSDGIVVKRKVAKRSYNGIPIRLFMQHDTAVVVSENFLENKLGDIRITMFDTTGKELLHSKMSRGQFIDDVYPDDVFHNRETKSSFLNTTADLYNINCIKDSGYIYVFYNDNLKPATFKTSSKRAKALNTYCMRVGSDGSVRRVYTFGKPSFNQHFTSLMGSTDYDNEKKSYASLIIEKNWYKNAYRMAWSYLK